ncbi:MAG: hypothetical protein ACTSU3_08815 [Candidatus Thorarchaeota archaeon]
MAQDSTLENPQIQQSSTTFVSSNAWENRPFLDSSPFNTKIPENAEIEPNSDEIVNNMVNSMSDDELYVGIEEWSVPVFFADSETPRYDIDITDEWAIWDVMQDVPIPDNAVPDPEEDGHMCIVDNDTLMEYDFWQAEETASGWTATWGNMISLNSDGIYPDSWGARGSGFALTAGLIFPHEVAQGQINHALVYSTDWFYVKAGGAVRPATTSDGRSEEQLAIPEGTRLQLDPTIDIDSLDLPYAGSVIAKAMQEYGMFLCDNGGGHQVYAYNPINSENTWGTLLPTDEDGMSWIFESKISITDFRILKIGPQIPDPSERTTLPDYTLYTIGGETFPGPNTPTDGGFLSDYWVMVVIALPAALILLVILRRKR